MEQEKLRINARALAGVLEHRCPRCFWVMQHLGMPGKIRMPAVFGDIDRATKEAVRGHLGEKGRPPDWLPWFVAVRGYVPEDRLDWRVYQVEDPDTGLVLCGSPDEILMLADGSYHIVDYKTARITDRQDELFPEYEVQLNAYAYIARYNGLWPVSGLSLVYFEPRGMVATEDGPALGFSVELRPVALRLELVRVLLRRAAEILRLREPPAPSPDCEDCERRERFARRLSGS